MIYRRERPKCRKVLENLMDEFGWDARELYEYSSCDYDSPNECGHLFCLSSSLRIQLRKMIEEGV